MKIKILQIFLLGIILTLGTLIYFKIAKPALQVAERNKRYKVVKHQLEYLRILEASWRLGHDTYCSSFDSLLVFYEYGVVPIGGVIHKKFVPARSYVKSLIGSSPCELPKLIEIKFVENEKITIETGTTPENEPWVEISASNSQILKDFSTDFIMQSNEELEIKTGFASLRIGNRYDQRPLQASWDSQ